MQSACDVARSQRRRSFPRTRESRRSPGSESRVRRDDVPLLPSVHGRAFNMHNLTRGRDPSLLVSRRAFCHDGVSGSTPSMQGNQGLRGGQGARAHEQAAGQEHPEPVFRHELLMARRCMSLRVGPHPAHKETHHHAQYHPSAGVLAPVVTPFKADLQPPMPSASSRTAAGCCPSTWGLPYLAPTAKRIRSP